MTVRQGALQFMMPIDGDKIWQPSLVSRRLLEEHLCFWGVRKEEKGANIHANYCKEFTSLFVVCYRNARPFPKLHTTHLDGHFAINPVLCRRIIFSLKIEMQDISNTHITL